MDASNPEASAPQVSVHETIAKKIAPFEGKLSRRAVDMMGADRTKETNYKVESEDNQYVPGIFHTTESWVGGSRNTRTFNENYQPRFLGDHKPGDYDVTTKVTSGGYGEIEMTMQVDAEGSLTQETRCTTTAATAATYGTEPLMRGEFFKYAGQGNMSENVKISPTGEKTVDRFWVEDRWVGHDRYQTILVKENNGVVSYGSGEHGIVLGYLPEMRVVSPPAQK